MHQRQNFSRADPAWDEVETRWMAELASGGPAADAALSSLFWAYQKLFVRHLIRMRMNEAEAEDQAQELWLEIVRAAPRYRPDVAVRYYFRGFLGTVLTRHFSKLKQRPPAQSDADESVAEEVEAVLLSMTDFAGGGASRFDFLRCVRAAFERFERAQPRLASLLLFRHVEEMSLEEIALALGVTAEKVKADTFRARRQFEPLVKPCIDL
jgi:RNA polymerase sigma-70 factor, ECF subfamily